MLHVSVSTLILATICFSCGDGTGTSGLSMADVAGSYHATSFESEQGGQVENQLALGGSIQLTLATDGITSGRLFIPMGNTDGSDFDADLAGTWTLDGQAVMLDHVADTFLRDIVLAYVNGELVGERASTDLIIRVVLSR